MSNNGASWEDVLNDLACFAGKKTDEDNSKPFPLYYEELFLHRQRTNRCKETEFKKRVAKKMAEMEPIDLHRKIASAGFDHIMTTNYDYCIEYAGETRSKPLDSSEIRYSLFRRHQLNKTIIWHIHGEIERPISIALGYEHYVGTLSTMRDYLFRGWDKKAEKRSLFMQKSTDFDDTQNNIQYSWLDVFLRDDIHMLGLGLDYCEIDLWWLLVVKEKLRYDAFDSKNVNTKVGETYYYTSKKKKAGYISKLESLGVQIKYIPFKNDWHKFYEKALTKIIKEKQSLT